MSARHGPRALLLAFAFLISLVLGKELWDLAASNPEYEVACLALALFIDAMGLEGVRPLIWYSLSLSCIMIAFALTYVNVKQEEKINVVFTAFCYLPLVLLVMVMIYTAKRAHPTDYALPEDE